MKKAAFVLLTSVGALSFIQQSSSYTYAQVKNSASVSVVSSEKALISIPQNIELSCQNRKIGIQNNMAVPITLKRNTFEMGDATLRIEEDTDIDPSDFKEIPISVDFAAEQISNEKGSIEERLSTEGQGHDVNGNGLGIGHEDHGNGNGHPENGGNTELEDLEFQWPGGSAVISVSISLKNCNVPPVDQCDGDKDKDKDKGEEEDNQSRNDDEISDPWKDGGKDSKGIDPLKKDENVNEMESSGITPKKEKDDETNKQQDNPNEKSGSTDVLGGKEGTGDKYRIRFTFSPES